MRLDEHFVKQVILMDATGEYRAILEGIFAKAEAYDKLQPQRVVMCRNKWPEPDQHDFKVFAVEPGESDEAAIERAKEAYSPKDEFYIEEVK